MMDGKVVHDDQLLRHHADFFVAKVLWESCVYVSGG